MKILSTEANLKLLKVSQIFLFKIGQKWAIIFKASFSGKSSTPGKCLIKPLW